MFQNYVIEVFSIHNQQFDLWIQGPEGSNLGVLLSHETLLQDRELDEDVQFGQIEVGAEPTSWLTLLIPSKSELDWFVFPLVLVEA